MYEKQDESAHKKCESQMSPLEKTLANLRFLVQPEKILPRFTSQ